MIKLRATDPKRDAPELHKVMGDEASCRYLSHPPFQTIADTRAQLEAWVELAPNHDRAIVSDQSDTPLGRVTIYEKEAGLWEIGIIICPAARGRHVAYDACRLAIDSVDKTDQPRRIMADIDPDNPASLRLFEKLGFHHEGILRANWETHIGVRDSVMMSLIASDPRPWRDA